MVSKKKQKKKNKKRKEKKKRVNRWKAIANHFYVGGYLESQSRLPAIQRQNQSHIPTNPSTFFICCLYKMLYRHIKLQNWYIYNSGIMYTLYSVSQKWVHPSHFCRYLSISLHGTILTKWHFDTMKSSLCAAYILELIYFSLKITQNITIKS